MDAFYQGGVYRQADEVVVESGPTKDSKWWSGECWGFAIACVLPINMIIFLIYAAFRLLPGKFARRPSGYVVNDMCKGDESDYKYLVKVKTGRLPIEILEGRKVIVCDLNNVNGEYVTRIVLPVNHVINDKEKAANRDEISFNFTLHRAKRLPKLGYIRLDHGMWKKEIKVYLIDIVDLNEGTKKVTKFTIATDIKMLELSPNTEAYSTEQIFKAHDLIGEEGVDEEELAMGPARFFMFTAMAANLGMILSCLIPRRHPSEPSEAAANGAVGGIIALAALAVLVLMHEVLVHQFDKAGKFFHRSYYSRSIGWILVVGLAVLAIVEGEKYCSAGKGGINQWMKASGVSFVFTILAFSALMVYMDKFFYTKEKQRSASISTAVADEEQLAIGEITTMKDTSKDLVEQSIVPVGAQRASFTEASQAPITPAMGRARSRTAVSIASVSSAGRASLP